MNSHLLLAVVLSLMIIPVVAFADDDASVKDDRALLKGSWKIESSESDGKPNEPPENEKQARLTFEKDHVIHDEKKIPFTIDPTTTPKLIDLDLKDDPNLNRVLEGIYKLDGDTLTLCIYFSDGAKNRPSEFSTAEGSSRALVRLKRIKE